MADSFGFEIDEEETFKDVIIENQIDVEVAHIGSGALLTCHKGKAAPHLHDKLAYMIETGVLYLRFIVAEVGREA